MKCINQWTVGLLYASCVFLSGCGGSSSDAAAIPTRWNLEIAFAGSGVGAVTGSGSNVQCSSGCTNEIATADAVSLSATPSAGSAFVGWEGPCTGTGTCTVSSATRQTVIARFARLMVLTVENRAPAGGAIAIQPGGLHCPPACTHQVADGAAVSLVPQPATGYKFAGWIGFMSPCNAATLVISAPLTCTAAFTRDIGASRVTVAGRQLMVERRLADGSLGTRQPYLARGVVWSPSSEATNTSSGDPQNANTRRIEFDRWYRTDIPLLAAMSVNTVRLPIDPGFEPWNAPAALLMLDALYEANMMAVITVDDGINNIGRVREAVTFFRGHPAVLAFSLGSEPNLNLYFGAASSVSDVVVRTENAAKLVKSLTTHPVVVSWGDVDVDRDGLRLADTQRYVNTDIPSADIWMLNVFRGSTFGRLWEQWAGISSKPILLGEWGTDSFRTTSSTLPITGVVDQQMQADWDVGLWNDILRNASARNPASVAIGGFALEFVDALWKVPPFSSQQSNGFASGGQADGYSNEEYYGIVSSNRTPKAAYQALATVFAPGYSPPPATLAISARSSGAAVPGTALGLAQFWLDGQLLYSKSGGAGGGRGINVATFLTGTGNVFSIQNFDTWGTRGTGTAFTTLFQYLDSLPAGAVVAVAVGDDAGLNRDNSCERWPFAWTEELLQRFETMGSTRIRSYCFRHSWSFVAVMSEGRARGEHLAAGSQTTTNVVIER